MSSRPRRCALLDQSGEARKASGPRPSRRQSLLVLIGLALLLCGSAASGAQAAGEPTDTVAFSCSSVTYTFTGFPSAGNTAVIESVSVDGEKIATGTFTFTGSTGSNTLAISVMPGHHSIDGRAQWNTNGVRGGKDTPLKHGIICPPQVTSITPTSGPTEGGTLVTIKGGGFLTGATVTIGAAATSVEVLSEGEITAKTAATPAGEDEVVVTDKNGTSTGGPKYTYLAPPPPHVTSIAPTFGTTEGGTAVTIKGSGFLAGATVTIGGAATEVEVESETEIIATTAAGTAGSDEVVVSDLNGTSKEGPSYTYLAPAPHVTSITPTSGTTEGGTPVTIKGSGFLSGATVAIGGAATSVKVLSQTEITATTATGAAGADEVVVMDANGTSSGGPSYTYVVPTPIVATVTLGGVTKGVSGSGVLSNMTGALPAPQLAVSGNLAVISGTVLVQLPGSSTFVALAGLRQVPFGTVVDARHGKVSVTTMGPHGLQTIVYYEGEFILTQGHNGLVVATLFGGDYAVCPTARERAHLARASSRHTSRKHLVRKLWSEGHGSYSTNGNYAAGAVLGTRWLTEDRCNGTLIRVFTDRVVVTNFVNHRHVTVKAGHSYLAKAR